MSRGRSERVPVPSCAPGGDGQPAPEGRGGCRPAAGARLDGGSVPVKPQFIDLLRFIWFMLIGSCFCSF